MSQTLLTNFFTVRKPGSQGENFKQNLARGKEAAVNKRKREDEEEEDDWNKEDPPDATTSVAAVEEDQAAPIPKTPTAAGKIVAPLQNDMTHQEDDQASEGVSEGGKKKVIFHKLSGLSPRKAVRGRWEGAAALARAEATPEQSTSIKPPSAKRPTVSRNLFSDEDELHLKKRTADLARTVKSASEVKAKLTPAEVKAKLGNVKLKDLKARLASLDSSRKSSTAGPVKVTARPPPGPPTAPPVLLELDTPPCTPRKTVLPTPPKKRPERASPRKEPAFQRFHSLTQRPCKVLPLPYKYRMLAEVFQAVDTIVSLHFNRNDTLVVSKLEEEVKRVTSRPWLPSNLPQIRCLFPEAFIFAWVPIYRGLTTNFTLKVPPNLGYRESLQCGSLVDRQDPGQAQLTSEDLVNRRQIFHNALLQLVKDQHATFLSSLNPPITVADALLTAWHR